MDNFKRYIINLNYNMVDLFKEIRIPYNLDSTMFCPFHENTNTPASKLYIDEVDKLWCFAEHRIYTASDVLSVLMHKDLEEIYNRIVEERGDNYIEEMRLNFDKSNDTLDISRDFMNKKLNITSYLNNIVNKGFN